MGPEVTGEQMQQAYDESDLIKKVLKEDFRKRNRKHRKNKKGTNPIKTILTVLSGISLIYMVLFIMMKSTEDAEIKIKTRNERIIKVGAKSENNKNQIIKNQNKCSNQLANQAINKFLEQQEKKWKK